MNRLTKYEIFNKKVTKKRERNNRLYARINTSNTLESSMYQVVSYKLEMIGIKLLTD